MVRKKKLTVIWTRTAENQLFNILEYWTNRNKSSKFSKQIFNKISDRIELLANNPLASKVTEIENVRLVFVNRFSLVFQMEGQYLKILALWDQSQDFDNLLQKLKETRE